MEHVERRTGRSSSRRRIRGRARGRRSESFVVNGVAVVREGSDE